MANDSLILGAHLSIAGGLHNALLTAKKYHCQTVQLFVTNQRRWVRAPLSDEEVQTFLCTRKQTNINPVIAHGSYLINLAAIEAATYKKSLATLADELNRCKNLAIDYYVIHPGAHMGRGEKAGLDKVADSINSVFSKIKGEHCRLLLETTARQGTSLGHRFEHLAYLIVNIEKNNRVGVCLDTSHIFAAGYDIRSEPACHNTLKEFDRIISLDRLKVIHTNDSKTPLGSRVDRHEHIGKGKLGRQAFRNFLTDRRTYKLPFILETPKGKSPDGRDLDLLNLAALRRLARKSHG